jgi:PTH1 family peptidyl-tRNA hydrolase
MNEAGRSVGPARGAFKVGIDHVLVIHDEIDLPFGRIQVRRGGGVAGHNGLRSVRDGLGSADFTRVRTGVGRPDTTDPEIVSAYVLGRFRESREEVEQLIERAADAAEELIRET